MYTYDIAASIVAYKTAPAIINKAIYSFLQTELHVAILIIDNSPTNILYQDLLKDDRVTYIFNNKNVGFSKAHNQGINYFRNKTKYFLVLNPDVYFEGSVLTDLFEYMEANADTGLIAPKVLYPNGRNQISRRLIPSPIDLIVRRLPLGNKLFHKRARTNEYLDAQSHQILEVPFLLGCFMFLRATALAKSGLFDERYFVYLEDLDLCRRMNKHYKVVYHGQSKIYHIYQRDSSKNLKMLFLHTISMIKYFNKWGWLSDADRKEMNYRALALVNAKEEENKYALADSMHPHFDMHNTSTASS
ncbi:glycosyltransferase family 2 protein [uncultured Pontibacter sp.]|uniref:glycosyltransferase n=1 Tax=uncultured Pontibacter sp. TaxID=453356 RepID=UPI0026139212|nr:glycosyltransferase family 2 protein [uncultured Pontibacter sp.]